MSTSTATIGWSSRFTFIMACTGSAVGLGSIWKFPYIAGVYGGGAFVLVYLLCISVVAIPIMIAETLLGRAGRADPAHTMRTLAFQSDTTRMWSLLGVAGMITGILIMMYYSVVAGWILDYTWQSFAGTAFPADGEAAQASFNGLLANDNRELLWHSMFVLACGGIVALGVTRGIGKAVDLMMPLLFVLLIALVAYAAVKGNMVAGLHFLFDPDFSKLTATGVLVALGHSFFTLSIGMGAIMMYGAYMPPNTSISSTVITVALLDTVVSIAAGMAIFPIVFAHPTLQPGEGPGLMFVTLPTAFGSIAGGHLAGIAFFLLVTVAALSSAISLLEPSIAWLERQGMKRWLSTALVCGISWIGGYFCLTEDFIFAQLDFITSNIMLPLGGLLIAIFTGWFLKRKIARNELGDLSLNGFNVFYATIRVFAPLGVIIVFLHSIGLFELLGLTSK
jgi:NSS family neurotransmitter:Na+ symporter